MNYLLYVEHSAENLQFYMWHQNYVQRFNKAPESDRKLAPEWTAAMEDEMLAKLQKEASEKVRQQATDPSNIFRGTDFDRKTPDTCLTGGNPFVYISGPANDEKRTYGFRISHAFSTAGARIPCE